MRHETTHAAADAVESSAIELPSRLVRDTHEDRAGLAGPIDFLPDTILRDGRELRGYYAIFDALVERLGRIFGRAAAEDAVQELFVRLLRTGVARRGGITFNYLYVCARRLARRVTMRDARRNGTCAAHAQDAGADGAWRDAADDGETGAFAGLLHGLTRREWEVLWLTCVGGLSNEQAGASMALPASTVRGIRQRALASIRARAGGAVGR